MRISTAEENAKGKIAFRIPVNLATVRGLLRLNARAWDQVRGGGLAAAQRQRIGREMTCHRRKLATLDRREMLANTIHLADRCARAQ